LTIAPLFFFVNFKKTTMNEAQDERPSRIAGWKDEVFGTMKEKVGRIMKKQDMEWEGKMKKERGQREKAAAKAKKAMQQTH